MSVTVADLLRLPSLRQATVAGGQRGLNKIVSSISVLESADPAVLVDGVFRQGEFFGSEIVITGFLNCRDDVECQCANIRRLAEGGEVGLILFYVGIFMPAVDQKLIALADSLDFVLIQMPCQMNLRYGEVISDVTECIYNDRTKNETVVTDILAGVSRLPEHQRTISTVLRMVSDRVRASVILADASFQVLNLVAWPKSMEFQVRGCCAELRRYAGAEGSRRLEAADRRIYHVSICPDGGAMMHLFLIREGEPLGQLLLEQVEEVVRICINIWGKEHGAIVVRELIRAILQDDPIKMRRLSDIFHIDIAQVHEMWILCGDSQQTNTALQERLERFRDSLRACAQLVFADFYEDKLLLFVSTPSSEREAEAVIGEILAELKTVEGTVSLSRCGGLQNTTQVRQAYLCHQDYLEPAGRIYPTRAWFSLGDLEFVGECHRLAEGGGSCPDECAALLGRLRGGSDDWDVAETLSIYLLDSDSSVTRAAETMFLHKNTVKYRLRVISDLLGFRPGKMPDSMRLYQLLAVNRLLN